MDSWTILSEPNGLKLISRVSATELWECCSLQTLQVYSTVFHYDSWATELLYSVCTPSSQDELIIKNFLLTDDLNYVILW